ncbi:MAG TPA: hypothetical protein VNE21_03845 [Mycobacteriales bacterium]|nr:hypothetical protein [Mycobacteriales bacterium]
MSLTTMSVTARLHRRRGSTSARPGQAGQRALVLRPGVLAAGTALLVTLAVPAVAGGPGAPSAFGFTAPTYVSTVLGGGEPVLIATRQGTLVYSAHQGSTLMASGNLAGSPVGTADFAANDRNQVYLWTSTDDGVSWQQVNWMGSGFSTNPALNTGFSDPDLSLDTSGRLYATGIDLANDALFSSTDGGFSWPTGTVNCHDGDRPWLAGAKPGVVYLATDTVENALSHEVFVSTNGGASCAAAGIPDAGSTAGGGSYLGQGQLRYDPTTGNVIEPVIYAGHSGAADAIGLGILRPHATKFIDVVAARNTSLYAHWPGLAVDAAGNYYLVWDTDARGPAHSTGGCGGSPDPRPNAVLMSVSTDHGLRWSRPIVIAHPATRVLWPWVTAGRAGAVGIVWYEESALVDPGCGSADLYVFAARVLGATGAHPRLAVVDASGRPVHVGPICQSGTTCVVTGPDRRLGDYFTDAIDPHGCLIIATGDTMRTDPVTGAPLPTARPLFLRQDTGIGLTGQLCRPSGP